MYCIEKIIGDIDQDGQIDSTELNTIKQGLHRLFDTDDSGNIDTKELKNVRYYIYILLYLYESNIIECLNS